MPGGFGIGVFRGVGPQATSKRLLRSGPRRANVALQVPGNPMLPKDGNPVLPKDGEYPGIQTLPLQPAKTAFQRGDWPPEDPRIVTTNIGMIMTQFKRRNGVHTEVTVQHPDREPTVHRLWFGFEVLDDIAKVREDPIKSGRQGRVAIDISRFSEAVVAFLEKKGVDLADPDWGMLDDSIPFSNEFLPMRTLMEYYPDLPEAVVDACLTPEPEPQEPVVLKEYPEEEVSLLTNPFPFGLSPDLDLDRLRKKLEEVAGKKLTPSTHVSKHVVPMLLVQPPREQLVAS